MSAHGQPLFVPRSERRKREAKARERIEARSHAEIRITCFRVFETALAEAESLHAMYPYCMEVVQVDANGSVLQRRTL